MCYIAVIDLLRMRVILVASSIESKTAPCIDCMCCNAIAMGDAAIIEMDDEPTSMYADGCFLASSSFS